MQKDALNNKGFAQLTPSGLVNAGRNTGRNANGWSASYTSKLASSDGRLPERFDDVSWQPLFRPDHKRRAPTSPSLAGLYRRSQLVRGEA